MLVRQIAAVRNSVVLVLRVRPANGGAVELVPAGTASYLGNEIFLTANHLFEQPPMVGGEVIRVVSVPHNGQNAVIHRTAATIEYGSAAHDLALLRVPGFGNTLQALQATIGIEPDGRSVFSYGFLSPRFEVTGHGPILLAASRACALIIGARIPFLGGRYELDGHTYPGESGAPVFRAADTVIVGVVQATRGVDVPPPILNARGPTIASPLDVIAGELTARNIATVA